MNYAHIMFISFEIRISAVEVDTLMSHMDDNTLVVGPVLNGHIFDPGAHNLCGRKCPWNTCAIWALNKLGLIGFPMIGDGYGPSIPGGVEEVSAIALAQMLNDTWQAKLLRLEVEGGTLTWHTSFASEERRLYHEKKMASKDSRPASQMLALGGAVGPGRVVHVIH